MKAVLTNHRQSPRKVRLLADMVRGKKVTDALAVLNFTAKKSSGEMIKVINSAAANAVSNNEADRSNLFIKEIRINKGLVMKRFRPRARGRASAIRHRTSHIHVVLDELNKKDVVQPAGGEKPSETKTTRKAVAKKDVIKKDPAKAKEAEDKKAQKPAVKTKTEAKK